jgi:L-malate glycosyltransferase
VSGIHQIVPVLHRGDAVGQHALELQRLLHEADIDSRIYVELEDSATEGLTRRAADYDADSDPGDLLVYQYATASDLSPWLVSRSESFVVNYHNITPPIFFVPWNESLARHQVRGELDLPHLATRAALGVAVSEFNRDDLVGAGFATTAVIPPIITRLSVSSGQDQLRESQPRQSRGARWLSVGRLAPNKAIEDTLAALALARLRHDPEATLTIVGKPAIGSYSDALRRFTADLGLVDAVRFCGHVSDEELSRAYLEADVLVVSSEHEGFCLPVVEAMAHDLPVVAFRTGALPEVLAGAGVLIEEKNPEIIAGEVQRLSDDSSWRQKVIAAGRERLPELQLELAGPQLVSLLRAVHDGDTELPGVSASAIESAD